MVDNQKNGKENWGKMARKTSHEEKEKWLERYGGAGMGKEKQNIWEEKGVGIEGDVKNVRWGKVKEWNVRDGGKHGTAEEDRCVARNMKEEVRGLAEKKEQKIESRRWKE